MSSKLKGDLAPKPNKTPYQLRVEILHLAQHIVEDKAEKTMCYLQTQSDIAHNFLHRDYEEDATSDEASFPLYTNTASEINDVIGSYPGICISERINNSCFLFITSISNFICNKVSW